MWDPYDRDPLRDIMLKISPISGAAAGKYKLVIVTAFSLSGTGDNYYIPTPKVSAHEYESSLWTAYFDGTHGSSTELHYYANIDDDTRIQGNNLDFTIQLWRVDRYVRVLGVKVKKWDKKLVSELDTYHIDNIGNSEILDSAKYDPSQGKIYEAKVKVETIGVEKANTIAIYETNGTVFNGHYQEQERMNIIQLYVNDSGSGTPFEEGLNTIVIPTSLFTETIFNARVQNETLSETPIYSDDEEIFKFISVGRDGNTEQACEEIDFIIIRFDISSEDAMEVLNLLLECLVNDTTNETAIVYSYVSTKENGIAAVMMNLPFSVLGLIPWYCDFENSPMGSKPETFEDWFWKPLKTMGMVIIGVIITIGMGFVELFTIMVDFFKEILMDILPILAYILWLIIRVLILILVWIMFIFELLSFVLLFLQISIAFVFLSIILGAQLKIKVNYLEIQCNDYNINSAYTIGNKYCEFLELNIPTLFFSFEVNNATYETFTNFFSFGSLFEIEFLEPLIPKHNVSSSDCSFDKVFLSSSSTDNTDSSSLWNGVSIILSAFLLLENSNMGVRLGIEDNMIKIMVDVLMILAGITLFIGFLKFIIEISDEDKRNSAIGGMLFASGVLLIINTILWGNLKGKPGGSPSNRIKQLFKIGVGIGLCGAIFGIIITVLKFLGIDLKLPPPLPTEITLLTWTITLILMFNLSKNIDRRYIAKNWFGVSLFLFIMTLFLIGILPNL